MPSKAHFSAAGLMASLSRATRTIAVPLACVALSGCEATPTPKVAPPAPTKVERALPTVVRELSLADVIAALEAREPEPLVTLAHANVRDRVVASHARLDATARLKTFDSLPREGIAYSTTAPESLVSSVDHIFEGLVLLEPVALGVSGPESAQAICRMDDVLSSAARARAFAKMTEGTGTPPEVRRLVEAHLPWLDRAEGMRQRYLAKALRTKSGGQGCFLTAARQGMKVLGKSPEEKKKLASLFDALVASDAARVRVGDLLDLASLHIEVDDTSGGATFLERARGASSRAPNEDEQRRMERLEKELETTKKLATLGMNGDVHARADLLMSLDRRDEARALLEAFEPMRPRSPKTSARLALVAFQDVASHDALTKALSAAADEMRNTKEGPHDEIVAQVELGLEGARIVAALADGTVLQALGTARPRLVTLTDELAKWNPGRAGALRIFVDVLGTCEKPLMSGDFKCLLATLPELLPRAAGLKKSFPDEIDIDRATTFFTMFAKDHTLALELLTTAPSADGRKNREYSLDRARASVTLASVLSSPADVEKLRKSVDAIVARSSDPNTRDPEKEALEADFVLVSATLAKGTAQAEGYRKAAVAYRRALEGASGTSRARIVNALATLALREGKRAEASAMLEAYAGPKDWPFEVTLLAASDKYSKDIERIRALGKDGTETSKTTTELWKASLLVDKKEISEAFAAALAGARTPGYLIKAEATKRGIEWSGRMNLSLGLSARGHAFSASAYADLWFLPLPKVRLEDLEKRRKGK